VAISALVGATAGGEGAEAGPDTLSCSPPSHGTQGDASWYSCWRKVPEKMQVPTASSLCSFTSPLAQVRQLALGRRGLRGNAVFGGLDEAWKDEGKLFVDFKCLQVS